MTTIRIRPLLPVLAFTILGSAAAAEFSIPADQSQAAPAAAPATEAPYVGDPMELTAEQRAERSLRTIQVALERTRSNSVEDEETIVCLKQTPTGTHRRVINCATNRHWRTISQNSLASFTGTGGAGAPRKDEKVFSISMDDFAKLEKRFGKLPADKREKD